MKIKICDRCKKVPDSMSLRFRNMEVCVEKGDTNMMSWVTGDIMKIDLCERCFDDFWSFVENKNHESK